jgi:hypothetical protein
LKAVLIAALALPLGTAAIAADTPSVKPYQDFSNALLEVHAPASDGWYEIAQKPDRIVFGRSGTAADESFIAAVFLFRIPEFPDSNSFVEYVREGTIKDSPPDRFATTESDLRYSSAREYPCVKYHAVSIDKKARSSGAATEQLRIENFQLYCQHPTKSGLGFSVSFSQRGGNADAKLEKEAAAFMDSVQAAPPPKTQ